MARDGFVFHFEYMDYLEELSTTEQCQMIQAMVMYSQNGEDTTFEDRTLKVVWKTIKKRMDFDIQSYEDTCKKRAEAGSRGGRPKKEENQSEAKKANGFSENQEKAKKANGFSENQIKANESKQNQSEAKKADNDTDTDTDIVKKERVKEKSSRFLPPTREEVSEYCRVQELTVNADRFIDFYDSKGWMVGKNKMKDWKAACRNWSRSQKEDAVKRKPPNAFQNFEQRDINLDDLEAQFDRQFVEGAMQ